MSIARKILRVRDPFVQADRDLVADVLEELKKHAVREADGIDDPIERHTLAWFAGEIKRLAAEVRKGGTDDDAE